MRNKVVVVLATGFSLLGLLAAASAAEPASQPAAADWPQYSGPSRNDAVADSPKLLDAWPKDGPPLAWRSEWIPSGYLGGAASPVIADGKVFQYVCWKQPVGGGNKYKLITTQLLLDAGWLPDLPNDLAKKIEEARVSTTRPATQGRNPDWTADDAPKDAELDAFLEKNGDFAKYIKEFIATLAPKDAQKYGAYITRRFCMTTKSFDRAYEWDSLVKLSKLRDTALDNEFEWAWLIAETVPGYGWMGKPCDLGKAWRKATARFDTVICLDAATGKTLWKKEFPVDADVIKPHIGDPYTFFDPLGVCATPAVWNGKCYAAGVLGLYCLSAKDGSLLWQAKSKMVHASPAVANGIVFHYNTAYDAETGKVLWTYPSGSRGNASPALWVTGGKTYVIAANGKHGADNWCCLDMETGKVLWDMNIASNPFGFPVINGDIMVAIDSLQPRKIQAYKLSLAGAELLWSKPSIKGGEGSYTVWKDHVYFLYGNGLNAPTRAECLDLKTGDSKWISETYVVPGGSETPVGQPIAADGKILRCDGNFHGSSFNNCVPRRDSVHTFGFEMFAANADGKYDRLGRFEPGICPMTSPALADGRLYVRLEKCVACYDLRAKQD